ARHQRPHYVTHRRTQEMSMNERVAWDDVLDDILGQMPPRPNEDGDVVFRLNPLMCYELDWLLSWCEDAPGVGKHSYYARQLRQALRDAPRVPAGDDDIPL